jgi:glycosyltransferase involved in cell wall biosynthesis
MKKIEHRELTIGLVANNPVGQVMAGPGIRYFEFAKELAQYPDFKVILFAPRPVDLTIEAVKIKIYSPLGRKSLVKVLDEEKGLDYIIAQNISPATARYVKKRKIKYIADLYDPLIIEHMEHLRFASPRRQKNSFDLTYHHTLLQLYHADHILCASDRQKDFYVGLLAGMKLISPALYHADPSLSSYISLAPFGLSSQKIARAKGSDLSSQFPGLRPNNKVVLWGGGLWNWLDSLSVVKAIEEISRTRQDIKLIFLGVKHPSPEIKTMAMAQQTIDYCRDKKLTDRFVFFNFDWTPYAQRIAFLERADVGISTHFDNLETRFAFRTRILDYLWADLPMVATKGDAMADLIDRHDLGLLVDYQDSHGMALSITKLIDSPELYQEIVENIQSVKPRFYWSTICDNIARLILEHKIAHRPTRPLKSSRLLADFYYHALKEKYLQ